jgi:hypothetical protein
MMPSCSWLRYEYFPAEVPGFDGLVGGGLEKYIESQHADAALALLS